MQTPLSYLLKNQLQLLLCALPSSHRSTSSVCWTSINKVVLYELHWLFKLQSRSSGKWGYEGYQSIRMKADRKEDGKKLVHPFSIFQFLNESVFFGIGHVFDSKSPKSRSEVSHSSTEMMFLPPLSDQRQNRILPFWVETERQQQTCCFLVRLELVQK